MKLSLALLLVMFAAILSAVVAADKLRGVKPSSHNLYQGEYIECDEGKKVPIKRVNDNFCDCKDGLDEPGTAACPGGKFFCLNQGFRGAFIPSSWVDDGHCDCCDGSDESSGKCANTCEEDSKKYQASVAQEISMQERGLALRASYVAHAVNEHNRHLQLIAETESKLTGLDAKVEDLEKIKIATEEAYSAAHEKAQERIDAEKDAKGDEANKDTEKYNDDDGHQGEQTQKNEQTLSADDAPEVKPLMEEHQFESDNPFEHDDDEDGLSFWEKLKAGYADLFDSIALLWSGAVTSMTPLTDKEKAVRDWTDAKNERDSVKRELDNYRKFVTTDFGPDMAYHALYGNTYEFADKEYTYKLNAFNDVQQTKPGHSSNLGRWKGWDDKKPNVMIYENGDRCWGAPDRSTRVTLICGEEHKVVDVKEPNKCEYTMTIKTPSACSQAALNALKNGE